jgi:hypothetical protein
MDALYFYCDESGKYRKNPVVTISGIGAHLLQLERFNGEWNALLRSYELMPELHMSRISQLNQANGPEMPRGQDINQRIDALLPFADCMNTYLEVGLAQAWDVKGYNNLSMEVKQELGGSHDPYQLAFIRGLLEIVEIVGEDGIVSTICDDDEVTAWDTYIHYRAIGKALPEIIPRLAGITFAKSHHSAGLQAADMVAFLARREATERFWGKPNEFKRLLDYLMEGPKPTSQGAMRWFTMFAGEQELVNLANEARKAKQKRSSSSLENVVAAQNAAQQGQGSWN